MSEFNVPKYGVITYLPRKPKVSTTKQDVNKNKWKKDPWLNGSKTKAVYQKDVKIPKKKKENSLNKLTTYEELATWFNKPFFQVGDKDYVFTNIAFKRLQNTCILELTCNDTKWVLQKGKKGNIVIRAFDGMGKGDTPIPFKKGSTFAKINALFINLTWNFSFKELLWVGLDFFPCESEGKADSFLFTYSRPLNNAEENILKPKKQHKTFSSRENDKKELLFWVNNPYAEGDFFLWMDNPFLIIGYKKYLFKDKVIRQFDNNYVLVMTCCELKWALRENEKGKVSVLVFYKRQPVTIKKNTIIYEMYGFFTTITKGLFFKDFIEVLSKRIPCEPVTRFNLYLFDIPNKDIVQP